tara:strand:+ start:3437 stop:3694 length:258 start_codon:yes stop_codon:yes gene_type:complete
MKAINDYIVVDLKKTGPKKVSGLILTESNDDSNRYQKVTVISAGNLVVGIETGDVVYCDRTAGHGISWKDKLYYVIKMRDVVLVE